MGKNGLVSIILPTYNKAKYLKLAIESVIAQTYKNWELIIVDDGSTDDTAAVVKDFEDTRIKYHYSVVNRNVPYALNIGLDMVKGQFIARIDSDDLWLPEKIEKQMEFLKNNPQYDLIFTCAEIIDETGNVINNLSSYNLDFFALFKKIENRTSARWLERFFFEGNCLIHPSVLMRKRVFDEIGFYNVSFLQIQDLDYWIRAVKRFNIYVMDETLIYYRRFLNNKSQNISGNTEEAVCREYKEFSMIADTFFDDISDELFVEGFSKHFVKKDARTHSELLCERAFIYRNRFPELMVGKISKLINNKETLEILEKQYKYALKDFYNFTIKYSVGLSDYYKDRCIEKVSMIFIDTGKGYNDSEKEVCKYISKDGKSFDVEFDVSGYANIKGVRFDPCEFGCNIEVTQVSSNLREIQMIPMNGEVKNDGTDEFMTLDPIYLIESKDIHNLKKIKIAGKIFKTEDAVVLREAQRKMDCLGAKLKSKTDQVEYFSQALEKTRENLSFVEAEMEALRKAKDIEINELREAKVAEINELRETKDAEINKLRATKDAEINELKKAETEKINMIEQEIKKISTERESYKQQYENIQNAFFWRVTKPMRKTVDGIKCAAVEIVYIPLIKKMLKKIEASTRKCFPSMYERRLLKVKSALKRDHYERLTVAAEEVLVTAEGSAWAGEQRKKFIEKPLVSIIVPNFNHAQYLRDRLESIYNQNYDNYEVILLDDCSTDSSREILMEYAERYCDKTIISFNEVNGGKVFKQWNKGIQLAKGKLIWIAESDDWCDSNFLEEMVPQFEYESVMLAFARSVFMQDGVQIWTLEDYLQDTELDFSTPFVMTAHMAVRAGFGMKNIIPNVSSCMFRNTGIIPEEITNIWENIKLCGDWLFYLNTIKGGSISYTNRTTNYYRVHQNSTSLKIQKSAAYYKEQELISKYVISNYNVDPAIFEKVLKNLEGHYMAVNETDNVSVVHENYSVEAIVAAAKDRTPNVLMCCFSLQMGGGETYPTVLANEMKRQGIAVTFINFDLENYSDDVRGMLRADIPVVTLSSTDYVGLILHRFGAEIVHSHHASVDNILSMWIKEADLECKQIVTLHGMYEAINIDDCKYTIENLVHTCKKFIYIADKNLSRFQELGYEKNFEMIKIGNGLPIIETNPIDRSSLNIGTEDFVLCLVSRALPEKGWQEAVDAVLLANETSERKIHLILVGDGEMRKKLETVNSTYIHIVGQKPNVRDYFATSDMGFLPSRFKGESFPLVVIESLLSGKPVLATNIGELQYLLEDENKDSAGVLVDISEDWEIDVKDLANHIVELANNRELYEELKQRVPSASDKFEISRIVRRHLEIYSSCLNGNKNWEESDE